MPYDPIARAKAELKIFQSNIMTRLGDGSELQAIFHGCCFVDYLDGERLNDVVDWWVDHRLPEGGFNPNQYGLKLL